MKPPQSFYVIIRGISLAKKMEFQQIACTDQPKAILRSTKKYAWPGHEVTLFDNQYIG